MHHNTARKMWPLCSGVCCLLTLTSIFGMLSKPIKDWIPEFPALHRWIIPVERQLHSAGRKEQRTLKWSVCCGVELLTGPGAEGCDYRHSTGQHAGLSVLPVNTAWLWVNPPHSTVLKQTLTNKPTQQSQKGAAMKPTASYFQIYNNLYIWLSFVEKGRYGINPRWPSVGLEEERPHQHSSWTTIRTHAWTQLIFFMLCYLLIINTFNKNWHN